MGHCGSKDKSEYNERMDHRAECFLQSQTPLDRLNVLKYWWKACVNDMSVPASEINKCKSGISVIFYWSSCGSDDLEILKSDWGLS